MLLSLEQSLAQLDLSAPAFQCVEVAARWTPAAAAQGQVHLIIVLRGAGTLEQGAAHTPLRAGQVLVVDGRQPPSLAAPEAPGAHGAALAVAHGVLSATLLGGRNIFDFIAMPHAVDTSDSELFTGAIPEMLLESARGGPGSAAIVVCLVRRVVTRVLRDAWVADTMVADEKTSDRRQRLGQIVALMEKDPARQHTLDSLAGTAAMSRSVFHKLFRQTYGSSPLTLLREIRLKKAEQFLLHTDLPIKTIAARLGYRSRSYFWQTFKQAYGVDPEGYRNGVLRAAPAA